MPTSPISPPELTHRSPIPHRKILRQRVKREVAPRPFGVMVWAGELGPGGVEAAAGGEGGGVRGRADDGS
jgi:hypothetical protein